MKKFLFMFGVVIALSFLICNVYGYTTTENSKFIELDNIQDGFNYLNDYPFDTYAWQSNDIYEGNFEFIKNSDFFNQAMEEYQYYTILYDRVIFSNVKLYADVYMYDFRIGNTDDYIDFTINLYFESSTDSNISHNTKHFYFWADANGESITSTSLDDSIIYNLSFDYALDLQIRYSSSNGFSTYNHIMSRIETNYDMTYKDSTEFVDTFSINPEFSFIPTYSENYETCNLKLDIKNEPDYYTLEYAINSSSSTWYQFDNSVGVTVSNNCLVIVRMLDENGDEIFSNSFNVSILLGAFSNYDFGVKIDTPDAEHMNFTPILYNNMSEYYDISFSLNSISLNDIHDGSIDFSLTGKVFSYKRYTNIDSLILKNSSTYYLKKVGAVKFTLKFEIMNKETGAVDFIKTFDFEWSGVDDFPKAIVSTTNGQKDNIFNNGLNSDINDNLFQSDSLEIDWSTESATNTIKTFFESTTSFFNLIISFLVLMPSWITVPIYTLLWITIVLFVIKFIRG